MATRTILIFEQHPRWVPELERQFLGKELRIRGCRTLGDLHDRLVSSPHCVVILTFDAAPAECLETLGQRITQTPSVPIIVAASLEFHELEWQIRELGATTVLEEPIPGDEMAACCLRQFEISEGPTRQSPLS